MKNNLLKTLEISRNYSLNVAVLMPEDSYNFKPENAVWDFSDLLNHIAYGIKWWDENLIRGVKTTWAPSIANGKKDEIIRELKNSYKILEETINDLNLNEEAVDGFHATLDHITHHRGQAVLYLRCAGITPPEYNY